MTCEVRPNPSTGADITRVRITWVGGVVTYFESEPPPERANLQGTSLYVHWEDGWTGERTFSLFRLGIHNRGHTHLAEILRTRLRLRDGALPLMSFTEAEVLTVVIIYDDGSVDYPVWRRG